MSQELERVIAGLAARLEPVRPIARFRTVTLWVLLLVAAGSIGLLALHGVRSDVVAAELSVGFVAVLGGLALMAFGGLLATLGASVPGRETVARAGGLGLLAGLVLAAGSGFTLFAQASSVGPISADWTWVGFRCLGRAAALAVLPAVVLGRFTNAAAPRRPLAALAAAAGGALAFGSFTVHLSCASEDAGHVLAFHALAPVIGGVILWLALRLLLTPRRPTRKSLS